MPSLLLKKNLMSSLFPKKKHLINQNGQFDFHFTAPSGSSDEQCPDFKKMLPCTCREKNRFPIGLPKRICIITTKTYSVALTSRVRMFACHNSKRWLKSWNILITFIIKHVTRCSGKKLYFVAFSLKTFIFMATCYFCSSRFVKHC